MSVIFIIGTLKLRETHVKNEIKSREFNIFCYCMILQKISIEYLQTSKDCGPHRLVAFFVFQRGSSIIHSLPVLLALV